MSGTIFKSDNISNISDTRLLYVNGRGGVAGESRGSRGTLAFYEARNYGLRRVARVRFEKTRNSCMEAVSAPLYVQLFIRAYCDCPSL
jgi:hypothetical protein